MDNIGKQSCFNSISIEQGTEQTTKTHKYGTVARYNTRIKAAAVIPDNPNMFH